MTGVHPLREGAPYLGWLWPEMASIILGFAVLVLTQWREGRGLTEAGSHVATLALCPGPQESESHPRAPLPVQTRAKICALLVLLGFQAFVSSTRQQGPWDRTVLDLPLCPVTWHRAWHTLGTR